MKGKKRKVQYGKVILVSFLSLRNNRGANATQLLSQLSKKENNLFEQKKITSAKILLYSWMEKYCCDVTTTYFPLGESHSTDWAGKFFLTCFYVI